MRRTLPATIAALALSVTPAFAGTGWFIGANFGVTHYRPETGEGVTSVTWGDGTSIVGLWQPGLRVGTRIGTGQDELYADTGFLYLTGNGSSSTGLQISGNYQHDFSKPGSPGGFVDAGVGILNLGGGGTSTTITVIGAGLGYANPFADGHGRFRLEVRYDHQGEDTDVGLSAASLVSLRLGFDVMN